MRLFTPVTVSIFACLLNAFTAVAAPSGGPYGPRLLSYELPKDAERLVYVSPSGSASSDGTTLEEPTTIETAIVNASTGTAIILREGTYRTGDLTFNQGITIQPYQDEKVVFKGTLIASEWETHREGFWRIKWDKLFPSSAQGWWRREREGMDTPPWLFNNDMVFRNGELLEARGWEGDLDNNSYTIDYKNGYVYVNFDPSEELIEITAWDVGLLRTIEDVNGNSNDHKGPTIRGITMTQYAYRAIEIEGIDPEAPQEPGTYGQDVIGTTLEDVTISFCSRVAGYFRGDNMVFRHCMIADTGTEGLYLFGAANALLERNVVTRTNIEKITGYYASAVKIFNQSDNVVVRDNLIIDNMDSSGVWWDVGNDHAVFVNNWVENTHNGFFFEISQMAICAGNVFVNCPKGAWSLNSRDVQFVQNTFINSQLSIQRNARSAESDHFGWHPAAGPDVDERENHIVTHNLMVSTPEFKDQLLWVMQDPSLKDRLTKPQISEMHSNVFAREKGGNEEPIIYLSPVSGTEDAEKNYDTMDAFASDYPAFAKDSECWEDYSGRILKNLRLHDISILPYFPGNAELNTLPKDIRKLLNLPEDGPIRRGAYPGGTM